MSEFLPPSVQAYLPDIIQLFYLLATGVFIVGIRRLGSPATARSGNQLAALGMFIGLIVTLFDQHIISFQFIIIGIVVGSAIGVFAAKKVEMTAMPEMVAIFNGFGGGASALVAWGEFARQTPEMFGTQDLITIGLSILIGSITFTGSFVAFGKLKGFISGNPVTFPGQNIFNLLLTLGALVLIGWFTVEPTSQLAFWLIFGLALLLGILTVMPIGGADMPVVISLLNSYSGIAASMAGFVINNNLLIISGALVGAAGLILTNVMCNAMNRSLSSVLFGAFGGGDSSTDSGGPAADTDKTVRETTPDDVALQCAYADKVIITPGYGLAVAQAQHVLKEVADKLEKRGVEVKYGIHPVAGRMPGHMNVLLAEADVPYDQLYDMEQINPEFKSTDVVLIIGANDVVNPAAKTQSDSPIYGMPILNVDEAKRTIIFKRSLSPGFAGIDNALFYRESNQMFFGDAKDTLQKLSQALSEV
jgi:NAD(P) transhydrogenase subunit beta